MQWEKISVFPHDVHIHMNNALKHASSYLCGREEELCETRLYENLAQDAHLLCRIYRSGTVQHSGRLVKPTPRRALYMQGTHLNSGHCWPPPGRLC